MRRIIRTTGIAAAGLLLTLGVAGATDPYDQSPEGRAYLGFSFGGDKVAPRDLHYGLRVDQDHRYYDSVAPIMQLDFARGSMNDVRVNGLSVVRKEYRLQQAEEPSGSAPAESSAPADSSSAPADSGSGSSEAAPAEGGGEAAAAEEEGFFSGMWHGITGFFGGLFGGDEETAEVPAAEAGGGAAPEEASAAEAAPAEASAGGMGVIDWGLLAVGVVGVGAAAAKTNSTEEDPDRTGTSGSNGGGGSGGSPSNPPGCTTGITPVPCVSYAPLRASSPYDTRSNDPEYQQWLDGGTGHMGDLGG